MTLRLFVRVEIRLRASHCHVLFLRRLVSSYRTTVGYGASGPTVEQDKVR